MNDDVKRAIRACLNEADECERHGSPMSARDLRDHLRMALSALEAATVAPAVNPPLAVRMADDYLEKHRVSESWRIIDMLRDALVRVMDGRTP